MNGLNFLLYVLGAILILTVVLYLLFIVLKSWGAWKQIKALRKQGFSDDAIKYILNKDPNGLQERLRQAQAKQEELLRKHRKDATER